MLMFVLISMFIEVLCIRSGTDLLNQFDVFLRNLKAFNGDFGSDLDLSNTSFAVLENYEVNATPITEKKYPWIARVVHSRTRDIPHVCTAACIEPAIFITAARCIYTLKVNYTSIIYDGQHLAALAFVLPSETSKQLFDDIGFIVVKEPAPRRVKRSWPVIKLLNYANRTNQAYSWFIDADYTHNVKVIGYAAKKGIHKIRVANRHYNLTELSVVIGLDICANILSPNNPRMFRIPCYFACTLTQLSKKHHTCKNYLGVEGGSVIDAISNKLMGIATWGMYYTGSELPVGFAFANSEKFFEDFACAKKIRAKNGISNGFYQSICS